MDSRDDFLTRWSRRKRETVAGDDQSKPSSREARADNGDVSISPNAAADRTGPLFDPARLPSIESITAETDIRNFLAPFVPPELMRAALRRAWTTDVKIRDFVGLADYDWDFNTPGSMAGFGPLESTDALRRQAADLIGRGAAEGSDRSAEAKPLSTESGPDRSGPRKSINDGRGSLQNFDNPHGRETMQHHEAKSATIDQREKPDELPSIGQRRHGQALPR